MFKNRLKIILSEIPYSIECLDQCNGRLGKNIHFKYKEKNKYLDIYIYKEHVEIRGYSVWKVTPKTTDEELKRFLKQAIVELRK